VLRILAPLALALLAGSAVGARAGDAPQLPADLRELLPPGARPSAERPDLTEVDGAGGPYLVERIESRAPGAGDPGWIEVEYTVDPQLEERIRALLQRERVSLGHVILLDPATGAVFAYVSSDPEVFPATRAYPAASLMKVVTAAAVLRHAPEAALRDCRYAGSPHELRTDQLEPPAAGGQVESFAGALAISNNPCFAQLAVRDVGHAPLLAEIRNAGLLEAPGAGHPAGWVAPLSGDFFVARLGSGIAGSFISPLGAARLAAALAAGELVEPWWIARIDDGRGAAPAAPARAAARPVWSPETAGALRELLVGVTEHGTAASAFLAPDGQPRLGAVRVAGKTGSVSGTNPDGRYQWFIGVAPAEAPRVAIAAVVVNQAPGGSSASELAAAGLREVFCSRGRCDASNGERPHGRLRARDVEVAQAIARREQQREQERERLLALRNAFETAAAHEVIELDEIPRPIRTGEFDFPPRLRRSKVRGTIVLLLELSERGRVLDVQVDASDLPDFNDYVTREVKGWRFTPPTQGGVPVQARTRLPIPIHVH
jgi:TonB family protein